jgi:hypothetical protein
MSKLNLLLAVAFLISSTTGCGVFRSVEQWKCDRLGMCYFGTRPSVQVPVYQPTYQPVYQPPVQQGCCSAQPGVMVQP